MRQDQPAGIGLSLPPPFFRYFMNLFNTIRAVGGLHRFGIVGPIEGIRFFRPYVLEKSIQCLFVIAFIDAVTTRKVNDDNPVLCQELQSGR